MMKKNLIFIVFCSVVLLSCSKDFEEINTNPNTAEKALPQTLLAHSITSIVSANMSRSQGITNELMQVTVNNLNENDRIFRYDIKRTVSDAPWRNWYLEITNLKDMYTFAAETNNKTYMGISLICQSWVYSLLTDTYGDIPYFQANQAKDGIYTPTFDRQKDIYADLFVQLEKANEMLKGAPDVLGSSDPVYAGKAALWRKFGNSLYLRLLLRASGNAEMSASAIAKIKLMIDTRPADYPIIANNTESAILKWTGIAPYSSPFANIKDSDWRYPKSCSFFVDKLSATNDPCISKWVSLSNGLYEGIPSGYTYGQVPETKSTLPLTLKTEPLLGNMMNYPELQLLLAEAATKGWITSATAQSYYENGITNRITLWGRTVDTYLSRPGVVWDNNLTLDGKMELIHYQKYLALFFTDIQIWAEYRRTGHPVLPKGPGLRNGGVMPSRLQYPLIVQSTNAANYANALTMQGADELSTQIWWQKP